VKDARFVGQTWDAGNKLTPVVTVFDMKVHDVTRRPDRVDMEFTILSEPCTYRWGIDRVPLRLFDFMCGESLRHGQKYTVSNKLKALPAPGAPGGP
jgi:hypothetical protein